MLNSFVAYKLQIVEMEGELLNLVMEHVLSLHALEDVIIHIQYVHIYMSGIKTNTTNYTKGTL